MVILLRLMLKLLSSLEGFSKYLLAAVLLVVPLYPKFPLMRVPGAFVSIRLEDFLLSVVFMLTILVVLKNKRLFFRNSIFYSIILYLLVGFVSLFSSVFVTKTVVFHIGFLHWARRVEYFTPLIIAYYLLKRRPELLDFFLKLFLLVVFCTFLYGLGQRYLSWPIIITQNEEYSKGVALRWIPGGHINSTFAGHYDLATFLVLVLPIIISLVAEVRNISQKYYFMLIYLMGLWLLVSSASRISFLSYLFSFLFSLILLKKYKLIPLVLLISLTFTAFSPNLVERYKRFYDVTFRKIKSLKLIYNFRFPAVYANENIFLPRRQIETIPTPTPVFEDRSSNIRINVEWPRALRAFAKNPLLGTGYSSITLATDNDFLRALGETGILGFAAFIMIFFRIVIKLIGVFPLTKIENVINKAFLVGLIGALPGLTINALFIDLFEASKFAITFWLVVGMALGIIDNEKR